MWFIPVWFNETIHCPLASPAVVLWLSPVWLQVSASVSVPNLEWQCAFLSFFFLLKVAPCSGAMPCGVQSLILLQKTDTTRSWVNHTAGWLVRWELKADHTEDEPTDELQVLTVTGCGFQVTGGLRLSHPHTRASMYSGLVWYFWFAWLILIAKAEQDAANYINSPFSTTSIKIDSGIRTHLVENEVAKHRVIHTIKWFIPSVRIMFLNVKYLYSTLSKCVSRTEIVIMVSWNTMHK